MIKICQECGLEFEASNGNQKYCNRKHFRICKICGNKFEVTRYHLTAKDSKITCSKKCSLELRRKTNIEKYGGSAPACSKSVQEKMKETMVARYGVEHAAQSDAILDKMRKTNLERYGSEYYLQCDEGRQAIIDSWKDSKIRKIRIANIESTNLKKYGVKSVLANPAVREKCRLTYFEKTGYFQPFANPKVQQKIEETNLRKFGVRRPIQSMDIKQKIAKTNLDKYGTENPMQNINIRNKAQKTCFERYGNTCFLQSELGKQVTKARMLEKYNHRWYSQSSAWKISRMLDPDKIRNLMKFREDPKGFIQLKYDDKPSIRILANDLGIHENSIGQILIENKCTELVSYVYSYMEDEVYNFLSSVYSGEIQRNVHNVIPPQELDIYIPEFKLGIECNPTSTHNSSINSFNSEEPPISYMYHKNKTDKCEDSEVFLFHIFGSEWTYSRKIIESMLCNILKQNKIKIYARKCRVSEISASESMEFLNKNHRQGGVNSPIRLGLFHGDELVSVMTFGKMRRTIGTDSTSLLDCYELVRFCSKLNTSVIGGAGKLFKYFIFTYSPNRIRSFSDRAHTRGNLYDKLGFSKLRVSDPGYVWVDSRTDISYHRVSAQKKNIKNFLKDDSIDLSKTEKQIMEEHGFVQVFDSGTITWEWVKN